MPQQPAALRVPSRPQAGAYRGGALLPGRPRPGARADRCRAALPLRNAGGPSAPAALGAAVNPAGGSALTPSQPADFPFVIHSYQSPEEGAWPHLAEPRRAAPRASPRPASARSFLSPRLNFNIHLES